MRKGKFTYSIVGFAGNKPIRSGFSDVIYYAALMFDDKEYLIESPFELTSNTVVKLYDKVPDILKSYSKEVKDLPPGSELNNTKSTPAQLYFVDHGEVILFDDDVAFKKVFFKGKEETLVGMFALKREPGDTGFWKYYETATVGASEKEIEEVSEEKPLSCTTIIKSNDEEHLITGVVFVPDMVDAQGDILSEDVIKEAAHNYLMHYRGVDLNHQDVLDAYVVESYIAPIDFEINGYLVKKGSWVVSIYIPDDELWNKLKEDGFSGLSAFGVSVYQ